jgi:hypothetical protein
MERIVQNLPDYMSSSVSLVYSIIWFCRALHPELDYHGLVGDEKNSHLDLYYDRLCPVWKIN